MDFRSGSPSDNSGAEEMEVSLTKPKHRVVSLGSVSAGVTRGCGGTWQVLVFLPGFLYGPGYPWLLWTWTEDIPQWAEYLSSTHETPILTKSKTKMPTGSQGPVL